MKEAVAEAKKAKTEGEIPVGAVIVKGDEVISRAHNTRERKKNALGHAEIVAIDRACKKLGDWRLSGCEIFVTLEPCAMCAGAIIGSRMSRVVFGAFDPKAGCCGSAENLLARLGDPAPEELGGVLQDECETLLETFFKDKR